MSFSTTQLTTEMKVCTHTRDQISAALRLHIVHLNFLHQECQKNAASVHKDL